MSTGALRATRLVTAAGALPKRGADLSRPAVVEDACVAWRDGVVTYAGPSDGHEDASLEMVRGTIVPGFVDCHTHLPFIGWRSVEFAERLAGRTYRDLHGEGGIFCSARLFNAASDDEVLGFCRPLLAEMLRHGTTTVELKTGYGLSIESELRQARLARRLAEEAFQSCTVTLLACHAVPEGETRESWVEKACNELIPAAAAEGLVDAVDIYVEEIAFSLDDLRAVARAAGEAGVPLRCHVEQLSGMGASDEAVRLGAATVDHLNHIDEIAVEAIASSDAIAVLLPASTLMLQSSSPQVGALLSHGAAVAVATDFNPGTSPVLSMPEAIAFGCILYGLSPTEALIAATANAACALGLGDKVGTLEVGKRADFVLLEGDASDIPYRPGHNPVVATYIGGHSF